MAPKDSHGVHVATKTRGGGSEQHEDCAAAPADVAAADDDEEEEEGGAPWLYEPSHARARASRAT